MYLEEKLDTLIEKQKELIEMVEMFLPDLTTEKGVIHFLEITKNTFNNYLKNELLIEGKHFMKNGKKKVFNPQEIIKLKKIGIKGKHKTASQQDTLDFLNKKLGIMNCVDISEL
ncbi:MAG: hypothetical protein U9O56_01330 [Campylobacterota bacterium]|nr:hypothetical protein [Campylobacterota bacterium]